MNCTIKLTEDMFWVGGNDRRLALFENVHPVPKGMSYNSYIVKDEKTVLLDTVDRSVSERFFENVEAVLEGSSLDYLIVNHMEPDHSWAISELIRRYPDVKIVCNSKIVSMIKQYFDFDIESRAVIVKEGETLETGNHKFQFFMAPMVHWPEVMVTYDVTDKILYSADAFGTFGALNGNIFADELNIECDILSEARRYYTNIVGKYGNQVQALLKKANGLEINLLCPLHGPVWRKNISWFVEKYDKWSSYTPEETAVMIAYASVYGNTENAAEILAVSLAKEGVKNISMFDVSVTHPSYIVSEAFRCSHLVFISTTYNAEIFCNMQTLLHDLKSHNLQNRTVAFMENGSWAPTAGGLMRCLVSEMKNMQLIEETVSIRSSLKHSQLAEIDALVAAIMASMPKTAPPLPATSSPDIEAGAMFKLSYGLFVLTAREGKKDNGCIINTAIQVTDSPKRISIALNKANYTHDMILNTGVFNVSVLTTGVPFSTFQHFGFQSGRNVEKFADESSEFRSKNGVVYLPKFTNAYISGKVISTADYGTHTVFVAEVTEAKVLSSEPSVTYQYYADNIKPKPKATAEKKKGFICTVCGYIYEGDELPKDFICPICKHGAEVFEPLK